eukprot:scaffold56317_cov13-Tisochrysis_lutea.AAC.1
MNHTCPAYELLERCMRCSWLMNREWLLRQARDNLTSACGDKETLVLCSPEAPASLFSRLQ